MAILFRIGVAAAGVLLAASALAQDDEAAAAAGRASDAYQAGRYLEAIDLLRPYALDEQGNIKSQLAYQAWTQLRASVDDTPLAENRGRDRPLDAVDRASLASAHLEDALRVITERAAATRLVILNENHSASRDRAFGSAVARALRPLGYDTLAIETLMSDADPTRGANRMEALRSRGYPVGSDGYYLRDPEFADFLRQSLSIGYRPLAYEATRYDAKASRAASIAGREQQQAEALASFLARHPTAKLLVYVGFSHAAEADLVDPGGGRTRWMASRLKAVTHIDPLTIDQTTLGTRAAWPAAYDAVAARVRGTDAVLMTGSRPTVIGQYRGAVDLQVVRAPETMIDGRPDWLASMGRHAAAVPEALRPTSGRRLIQVFVARERGEAIPVDQIIVEAGKASPALMLPDDPVRYATQDGKR